MQILIVMKRLLTKYVAMLVLAMMVPASIAALTLKGSGKSSSDPYLIYNPDDWAMFRDSVSQAASGTKIYARLMRNFNLKGNSVTVGTSDKPFSGEFDGNGKTISLFSVKGTSSNFGLFGYANNAVIKDLNVNGSLISEFDNTGSVVGNANGATKIYNVCSSVDIYMIAERNHLGGIVGQASKTSGSTVRIKGCTYTGRMQVECSSDSNGGIVGYCEKNANVEIEYCSFRGTLSSKGDNPRVGGILGYADDDGDSQNFKYIRYCFCAGTLYPSEGTDVGIFAGCPRGKVPGSITNNTYVLMTTDETNMVGNDYNSTVSASKANNAKITIKVIGSKGGLVDWEYVNPTTSSCTKVKASATPNDGCQFNNWTNGSSSTTALSTSAVYTVDLNSSVNLFANFSNHIHTYDDGVVKTEATCVKSGLKLKTCTVAGCGYQVNSIIDAKGHGSTNGYTASYAWTGTYDAPECAFTLKCNDCKENVVDGVSLSETGGDNGCITHDAIVEPSKTTEGSQTYYGHGSYTDAINKKTYTEDGSGTDYSHKYTILYHERTAKVVYDATNTTMAFYYDESNHPEGVIYNLPDYQAGDEKPSWLNYSWLPVINPTKVVIDKSMADYPLTNLSVWFLRMSYLETIEGLEYFNTANVTDMHEMFSGCKVLKSLDLSTFNTSKVTDMSNMFNECPSLESISVSPKFVVKKDTKTETMFKDCFKMVGGMGTKFNSDHTDGDYARIDRGETRPGYFTGPLILAGDISNDGEVDIADLVQLVDAINNGRADSEPAADVDGDGDININDIKKLCEMILEQQ